MNANDVPIRIASTTLLVRDNGGPEVLMVKRNQKIDFFSGAMMFPGGKVESQDTDPLWTNRATGWHDVAEDERGPRIAALREAFEECGVLATAGNIGLDTRETKEARVAVEAGTLPFLDYVSSKGAKLDLTQLTLFSRWLTPPVVPKRFDTFFYLVAMPVGQTIVHDGRETVENEWVAPAEALRRAEAGERTILFPTRMNLRLLAQSPSIVEAIKSAEARPHRQVLPIVEMRGGERFLRLVDGDGYGPVEEPLGIG